MDDLEWDNNSVSNDLREPILNLADLDDEACADLLDALNDREIPDLRPVPALVGLLPDPDSFWSTLRVGELKTLLALSIGDEEAVREGCSWIHQLGQVDPARTKVYRCIESSLNLGEMIDAKDDSPRGEVGIDLSPYRRALIDLYGTETLHTAEALINGENRFFGLDSPGLNFEGCKLHRALLEAYDKVQRKKRDIAH